MFKSKKMDLAVFLLAIVLVMNGSQAGSAAPVDDPAPAKALTHRLKYLMISAAAFDPATDGYDFFNSGDYLYVNTAPANFVAPVQVPHKAVLKSVRIYFNDSNAGGDACVSLHITKPLLDSNITLTEVCSSGSSGNYESAVKLISQTVSKHRGLYLRLNIDAKAVEVYAVKIGYKKN